MLKALLPLVLIAVRSVLKWTWKQWNPISKRLLMAYLAKRPFGLYQIDTES